MWSQKEYRKFRRAKYLREAVKNQKQRMWLNKKTERQVQYIVILFFIGLLATGIYGIKTLTTWNYIIRIYLFIALVLSFFPIKYLPLIYKVQRELKLLMVVCGLSPFIVSILLATNFHFSNYNHTETHKVAKYTVYQKDHLIIIKLENEAFEKHKEIRKFSTDKFHFIPDSASFEIYEGYLGLAVVKKSYLFKE